MDVTFREMDIHDSMEAVGTILIVVGLRKLAPDMQDLTNMGRRVYKKLMLGTTFQAVTAPGSVSRMPWKKKLWHSLERAKDGSSRSNSPNKKDGDSSEGHGTPPVTPPTSTRGSLDDVVHAGRVAGDLQRQSWDAVDLDKKKCPAVTGKITADTEGQAVETDEDDEEETTWKVDLETAGGADDIFVVHYVPAVSDTTTTKTHADAIAFDGNYSIDDEESGLTTADTSRSASVPTPNCFSPIMASFLFASVLVGQAIAGARRVGIEAGCGGGGGRRPWASGRGQDCAPPGANYLDIPWLLRAGNDVGRVVGNYINTLITTVSALVPSWSGEFDQVEEVDPVAERRERFELLASRIPVMDLPSEDSLWQDSVGQLAIDLERLPGDREKASRLLSESIELYPNVGYNQGFDWALLAILAAVGGDAYTALRVYIKWAVSTSWIMIRRINGEKKPLQQALWFAWTVLDESVPSVVKWLMADPFMMLTACNDSKAFFETINEFIFLSSMVTLCSRQEFTDEVQIKIIEKTLEHGEDGPAVSLWVVTCLLNLAYNDVQSNGSGGEMRLVSQCMTGAARRVMSFAELERAAPIPLTDFVTRFQTQGKL